MVFNIVLAFIVGFLFGFGIKKKSREDYGFDGAFHAVQNNPITDGIPKEILLELWNDTPKERVARFLAQVEKLKREKEEWDEMRKLKV